MFNVQDYGAAGVAIAAQTLTIERPNAEWVPYRVGQAETIYAPRPGAELDSGGIQRAIDAAHHAGGGTVLVPAGDYLIGPIELRSRVQLHLEPGARLWGSADLDDYRVAAGGSLPRYPLEDASRGAGGAGIRRLVSAYRAEDIAITGLGAIHAQSPAFVIPWLNAGAVRGQLRRPAHTVLISDCRRVRVEGIQILDAPSWCLVFDTCRGVQVRGVNIRAFEVINSDGIDLVNTSDATISDCRIWCTDDGICLKNFTPDAVMGNIAVSNCVIRTLCNGVKIGTETIGDVQDVTFNNIVVHNPPDDTGHAEGAVNLNAMDGGLIRNINVANVVARNVDCALYVLVGRRTAKQERHRAVRPGRMERIFASNLQADATKYTSYVVGQPDSPVRDVHLTGLHVRKTGEFYEKLPAGPLPERPEQYPNPWTFGNRQAGDQLPASGLYLRHVAGLTLRDAKFDSTGTDARPAVVQENCTNVEA